MLGAGASLDAKDDRGHTAPGVKDLTRLLAVRFVDPAYATASLTQVADFAIQEAGLFAVQDYIADTFSPYKPTPAHRIIPTFRWRAIVTTNYDTLIETTYREHEKPAQKIIPIYKNADRWDSILRDPDNVPLLKLHGCITDTHDENCPLILSTDQYVDYTRGRDRLFRFFAELAAENAIAFVGYGLADQDIRAILQMLDKERVNRPRSFMISKSIDQFSVRYWSPRQVTAIQGTFDEAMHVFDTEIGKHFRAFRTTTPAGVMAISERFATAGARMSEALTKALDFDFDYVRSAMPESECDPRKFYSGVSHTWAPIIKELDVRRRLTDTVIGDYFLDDSPTEHRFVIIKAHAGAGKSVFLRRLAWEAANSYRRLCLYVRQDAEINSAVIAEVMALCKEHVYLFIDDVSQHRWAIESLLHNLGTLVNHLTIVGGFRTNEWNVASPTFQARVTHAHPLPYLTDKEVDALIDLLETHRCLDRMEPMSRSDRRAALKNVASRQLLVALHEATSGLKFEQILHDEFSRITPNKAKTIYLAICMLNQFDVPVRAGLIARRFGVSFEDFRENLFKPLEDVVITPERRGNEDYCYVARHAHVAEIVVRNELSNKDDLFNEYIAIFNELNLSFTSDKRAFQKMTQGNLLKRLFTNPEVVYLIYEAAEQVAGEDAYLLQQQALYEMNREGGDLVRATGLLDRAVELHPKSRIIKHSCAELCLRKADAARTDLEWSRLVSDAEGHCRDLKRDARDSYPYTTLVKAGIQRLTRVLNDEDLFRIEDWDTVTKAIERDLKEGLQRFPNDSFLLEQEAKLAKQLSESGRVFDSLQKSFAGNQRNGHVAMQLARLLEERSDLAGAQDVLIKALDANRNNPRLHYAYGEFLMRNKIGSNVDLEYHYRLAYAPGDNNYKAQLLHGRQLFIMENFDASRDVFKQLSRAKLPPYAKSEHMYPLEEDYTGTIDQVEAYYCDIRCDGAGGVVRLDFGDLENGIDRGDFAKYMKVNFKITFSMFGPRAFDVRI